MVAKGKECSDLFPAVVKNVVSKDPEVTEPFSPPHTIVICFAESLFFAFFRSESWFTCIWRVMPRSSKILLSSQSLLFSVPLRFEILRLIVFIVYLGKRMQLFFGTYRTPISWCALQLWECSHLFAFLLSRRFSCWLCVMEPSTCPLTCAKLLHMLYPSSTGK